ncbi:MAG: GNAT family N-acetyltransferase [Candidatus Diapherotrites archaeon]|uniref:GNAT family N-acetyltransferase n=1 Tax=Candidatus Iainarchaeum sp. TaxID=3101447 RepID=A0A8T4L6U2_9ARCH|nr:GNAT family N-acetyltransferase [Candidatus Diapherotrites archaeon]
MKTNINIITKLYTLENVSVEITDYAAPAKGIKYVIASDGIEIARAYLYVLKNDLHSEPWGFMEDVFVHDDFRGKGYGTAIVKRVIEGAAEHGCYKLICTSKHPETRAHAWYKGMGFQNIAQELRIDFPAGSQ